MISTKQYLSFDEIPRILVNKRKETIIRKSWCNYDENKKPRDIMIRTNKSTYYIKRQDTPKIIDEYTDRRQLYYTINLSLTDYDFDYLIINTRAGSLYLCSKETVEQAIKDGYVRTTLSQSEKVINIPEQWFMKLN